MFERVIYALLYICALALAFWLCVWVLGELGFALPTMVFRILVVMFVLIAILILWRLFSGSFPNFNFFPPRTPPPA
jgi:hypothetical protein